MSAAEALGPDDLAAALASELTRARQRGLDGLDLPLGTEGRVAVPHLDDLARWYTTDQQTDHVPLIRRLLRDALDAWARQGHDSEALTVRRLFFSRDGGSPGRTSPGDLLTQAEQASGRSAASFEKLRRALFRAFAAFLIGFVSEAVSAELTDPPAPAAAVQPQQAPEPVTEAVVPVAVPEPASRRPSQWLLTAGLLVALVVVGVVLLIVRPWQPAPTRTGVTNSPSIAASGGALFTFDDLGGGSSVIRVFPGVKDTTADQLENGTFFGGQTTTALCKTTGRLASSVTSAGERPRSSNVWLEVLAQPGKRSFARLIYGDIDPAALARLPQCTNVP